MACSRKQRKALCFCVALQEEGRSRRREKRQELFLRLHSSSAASPAAYSPRRLISRLLLSFNRSSPLHNGGAPVGGAVGRKPNEERAPVEIMAEDCKIAAVTPDSRKKKSDELSLNLGMGVGLVFLLTRSAAEINKMVELRKQMEILLEDIKNGERGGGFDRKNHVSSSASNISSNQNTSRCARDSNNSRRRCLEMYQMEEELEEELERLHYVPQQHRMELEAANAENFECGVSAHELRTKLNQLVETRQQQGIAEIESSFYYDHETDTENSGEVTELDDREEEEEDDDDDFELRRIRLQDHQLQIEAMQRERIAELECALECAERKLRAKEREVCWWRDSAKLVSDHINEPLFR